MRAKPATFSWYTLALSLAAAFSLYQRLFTANVLNYYDDDAFYYFQIARNLVLQQRSSFDSIHLTNGYHPLWLLTLTALTVISAGKFFFFLVQTVALGSFVATFLLARNTLRFFTTCSALPQLAATAIAVQTLLLIRGGMEVTLTIPLTFLLCWYRLRLGFTWSRRNAIFYGLIAALIVLSRLDAILLIAPLLLLDLIANSRDNLRAQLTAITTAATPVALYVLSNRIWFHTWTPISGEAKQLRLHHTFNLATIAHSLGPINGLYRTIVIYPALIAITLGIIAILRPHRKPIPNTVITVAIALILFPILQLLTFWTLSDWPIWPWYIYTFTLQLFGGCLLLSTQLSLAEPSPPQTTLLLFAQGGALTFTILFAIALTNGAPRRWYPYAQAIALFAQTHDGIYAMGDCSGTAGYLIRHPLVQTEGLVMDAAFLANIRRQRPLNDVLRDYNVRYYITVDATFANGCYRTREPIQAGPDSPHMDGLFCHEPVTTYPTIYGMVTIFDLQPNAAP